MPLGLAKDLCVRRLNLPDTYIHAWLLAVQSLGQTRKRVVERGILNFFRHRREEAMKAVLRRVLVGVLEDAFSDLEHQFLVVHRCRPNWTYNTSQDETSMETNGRTGHLETTTALIARAIADDTRILRTMESDDATAELIDVRHGMHGTSCR